MSSEADISVVSKRRVKIVCTLGPSSSSPEKIQGLIQEGMDISRLNFSHGTHEFHKGLVRTIRDSSTQLGRPVAIMQDLQGPKLRAGKLPAEGIQLNAGDVLLLHPEGASVRGSTQGKKPVPISAEIAEAICRDVKKGARILFDDGKIATRASQVDRNEITVEVEVGGKLTSHKGMNLPGTPLSIPCCTEKDIEDLHFGLGMNVDAVALSFVRTAKDIEFVREMIRKNSNHHPIIIAKIEREEAVELQDSIIEVSDGLLVARGDMAVELGADRVPVVQKGLIRACNEIGVPIITATQMLESMIASPTPTRAEASDVANAVFDGTDAVMLSGETASGQYPLEAVRTMSKIIVEAERWADAYSVHAQIQPIPGSVVDSVEYSAAKIAQHVGAVAIACVTHSGMAARTLAKYRPVTPIIALMDSEAALRRIAFCWGVRGVLVPKIVATDDVFGMIEKVLKDHGLAGQDDMIVITAGIPTLGRGTTNMVKVHKVGAPIERMGKVRI